MGMRQTLRAMVPEPLAARLVPAWRGIFRAWSRLTPGDVITYQLVRRYCVGHGLEVGPGAEAYCSRGTTRYVDKFPELPGWDAARDIEADASDIPVADDSQDYVLSSHALEHCPNTILTLKEWLRVIRPGGFLFLILPHGDRTFDHTRTKTSLQHHIDDFDRAVDAADDQHDAEAMVSWSVAKFDPFPGDNNAAARGRERGLIHYHVWTQNEIVRLMQYLGLHIVAVAEKSAERHDSFIVVGRK